MWKKRNVFIHGEHKKGHKQRQLAMCQKRVQELYQMDRGLLTLDEKEVFKLPIEQRLKQGIQGLALWIDMTEMIHDNARKKVGKRIENPMFKRKQPKMVIKVNRRKPKIVKVRQRKKKNGNTLLTSYRQKFVR